MFTLPHAIYLGSGAAVVLSPYATAVTADAPLSYWRLGESSGTTAVATGSAAVNGTYSGYHTLGTAGLITGDPNTAVSLAPVGSGTVSMGRPSALNLSRNFTIEAWIKPTAIGGLLGIISFGTGGFYIRVAAAGQITFLKSRIAGIGVGATILAAATRYYVALTMDGSGNWVIYLNGAVDASGLTSQTFAGTESLQIGSDDAGFGSGGLQEFFDGVVDEVAIFGAALTATRISAHYAAGL